MTDFEIILTDEARSNFNSLKNNKAKESVYKAVSKAILFMSKNLRHPSLATHEFHSKQGFHGEKVFESYAQNKTPGAYRIFWHYGPGKNVITIIAITPHP